MIRSRKLPWKYLIAVLLFACNSKEQKPPETKPAEKDTSIVINEKANPYAAIDISPMDMSYYPVDYPKLKMTNSSAASPAVRVIYSRPHRQNRKIFGNLLSYGEPWRLGANEATEIDFFRSATIQGRKISAGRYVIYCVPFEDKWIIALNSNIDSWGLKINSAKDIQRFEVPVIKPPVNIEYFTMVFEKSEKGADLFMAWDDVLTVLPIEFTP